MIGHEITHGFDDRGNKPPRLSFHLYILHIIGTLYLGRLFDEDGNLRNWWENATAKEYILRANCIVRQYSNFFDKQAGLYIKGKQNLGENIADNGGVKMAHKVKVICTEIKTIWQSYFLNSAYGRSFTE